MKVLGIIPARCGSTRLRAKPLVDIEGKPMIQWVYENAQKALNKVVVATDDEGIYNTVRDFNGKVVMTHSCHTTGTDRCLEAMDMIQKEQNYIPDVVINIQGDEPLLQPKQISILLKCFNDETTELATLVTPVINVKDLYNESECFVVLNNNHNALYFSRSVIPHIQNVPKSKWMEYHTFYKHLGMYAYTPKALKDFAKMERTDLEKTESLEQNRWLENMRSIKVGIANTESIPVDTIDDLEKVKSIVRKSKIK